MDIPSLIVAFSVGVLGGTHCIGMCGGIMGALTMAVDADNHRRRMCLVLFYNLGRIASYVFIAWLFYSVIHSIDQYFVLQVMRYIAGLLLIAMGLYLANWWRGLVYLEKLASGLWRYLQPLSRSLIPVRSLTQALMLGALWGWLPCGLIYSALAYAMTAETSLQASSMMLAFGVGTLPAVMATGLLAERMAFLVKAKKLRYTFAVIIIIFGVWTLWHAMSHSHGHVDHNESPSIQLHQHH